jgi:predicted HAD superfamily Cof-like phosphohydrolase
VAGVSNRQRNIIGLTDFWLVGRLLEKFDLPHTEDDTAPHSLPVATVRFRLGALEEELRELREAYERDDLPGVADALVDLVIFALGTAHLHGLPWPELFVEVMKANMRKEAGVGNKERNATQGFDLVKPPGWRPPNLLKILREHGWGR